jgi:hypothetical protein
LGKFGKGNPFGRGNPLAGRAARIRAALVKELTPAPAAEIAREIIGKARQGELHFVGAAANLIGSFSGGCRRLMERNFPKRGEVPWRGARCAKTNNDRTRMT